MCMCIVFAFQLIRAKEVRKYIEVKRSEEKWREMMTLWRFACGDVLFSIRCLSTSTPLNLQGLQKPPRWQEVLECSRSQAVYCIMFRHALHVGSYLWHRLCLEPLSVKYDFTYQGRIGASTGGQATFGEDTITGFFVFYFAFYHPHCWAYILLAKKFAEPLFQSKKISEKMRK